MSGPKIEGSPQIPEQPQRTSSAADKTNHVPEILEEIPAEVEQSKSSWKERISGCWQSFKNAFLCLVCSPGIPLSEVIKPRKSKADAIADNVTQSGAIKDLTPKLAVLGSVIGELRRDPNCDTAPLLGRLKDANIGLSGADGIHLGFCCQLEQNMERDLRKAKDGYEASKKELSRHDASEAIAKPFLKAWSYFRPETPPPRESHTIHSATLDDDIPWGHPSEDAPPQDSKTIKRPDSFGTTYSEEDEQHM